MSIDYYFISDLHIGGDEALGVCDFENELIQFLNGLSKKTEPVELYSWFFVACIADYWWFMESTTLH